MKKIKRHLLFGFVEFTDGTFGRYNADGSLVYDVDEDTASAAEPSLYLEPEDMQGGAVDE